MSPFLVFYIVIGRPRIYMYINQAGGQSKQYYIYRYGWDVVYSLSLYDYKA